MKLQEQYLIKSYHDAAIEQKTNELKKAGYTVFSNKLMYFNNTNSEIDLYAEKGNDKKIFEFKVINKNFIKTDHVKRLKELSKSIGASIDLVYISPPDKMHIEFDGLAEKIESYFEGEGYPAIINELSTHTSVESLEILKLLACYIYEEKIEIKGEGVFYLELQWGSDADVRNDDGLIGSIDLPFDFDLSLSLNLEILDFDYRVDTSDLIDF